MVSQAPSEATKAFTIRVPDSLYRKLRERSEGDKIAINTLILNSLAMRLNEPPMENHSDPSHDQERQTKAHH